MERLYSMRQVFDSLRAGNIVTPVGGQGVAWRMAGGLLVCETWPGEPDYARGGGEPPLRSLVRFVRHGLSETGEWRGMWSHGGWR